MALAPRTRRRCSFRTRWVRCKLALFGQHVTRFGTPAQVGPEVLSLIMAYCRFHRAAGRSDKVWPHHSLTCQRLRCHSTQERKLFDERFIRLDTRRLCELTSAADALGMKSLVDLTSRALARMIEGKTPEEIRETFHLPDDLTGVWRLAAACASALTRATCATQRRRSWSRCVPPPTIRRYGC